MLAFLHIAVHGLAGAGCSGPEFGPGGESDSVNALKPDLCAAAILANRDRVVGVKFRLDRNITSEGETEPAVLERGLAAARAAAVPVMVHHTNSSLTLSTVLSSLAPGDIYTHTYSSWAGVGDSIVHRATRTVRPEVLAARQRGVLFDVGHGQGHRLIVWTRLFLKLLELNFFLY